MTEAAKIAWKAPFAVEVGARKRHMCRACGRASRQPFRDGAHKGTVLASVRFQSDANGKVFYYGCKHTGNAPICDGTQRRME